MGHSLCIFSVICYDFITFLWGHVAGGRGWRTSGWVGVLSAATSVCQISVTCYGGMPIGHHFYVYSSEIFVPSCVTWVSVLHTITLTLRGGGGGSGRWMSLSAVYLIAMQLHTCPRCIILLCLQRSEVLAR